MTAKAVVSGKMEQTEKYIAEFDRYMFCRSNPVYDKDGKLFLIVEQLQDITAMKHAEADIIRRLTLNRASALTVSDKR